MYIEAVPNRNSPPAILLHQSYCEGGKVRKRTLRNLSDWPIAHTEGLRGVSKGGTVHPHRASRLHRHPQLATRPRCRRLGPRATSASTAPLAVVRIAAATLCSPRWPVASLDPYPSSPPPVRYRPPPPHRASADDGTNVRPCAARKRTRSTRPMMRSPSLISAARNWPRTRHEPQPTDRT